MEKINSYVLKRAEDVLLLDKKLKHSGFMYVLEKDIKNLLSAYFTMTEASMNIVITKGRCGDLDMKLELVKVKPKKVGINA